MTSITISISGYPPASSTAGLMAATDLVAARWFSPAGSRRGRYLGITDIILSPTKAERDALYKVGINPIANIPGDGVMYCSVIKQMLQDQQRSTE